MLFQHLLGELDELPALYQATCASSWMTPARSRECAIRSHATGVAVVPTGPWPPYSFVPDFERAPLARVPAAAGDTVDRRAS